MKTKRFKKIVIVSVAVLALGILWLLNSEDSAPPIGFYHQPMQPAGFHGQGPGGGIDNFWSTRHAAGNFDSGNTRGYVNVPGVGPVGYGF